MLDALVICIVIATIAAVVLICELINHFSNTIFHLQEIICVLNKMHDKISHLNDNVYKYESIIENNDSKHESDNKDKNKVK